MEPPVAEKKTTTAKKSTAKKSTKTVKVTRPAKAESTGPSYDEIYAARLRMEQAHQAVTVAQRSVARARAYHGDFHQRDLMIAAALEDLQAARQAAADATDAFQTMKRQGRGVTHA